MNLNRIGIVTVCYRSMAVLPQMLASIPNEVQVVLVDNAGEGDAGELASLAAKHSAKLISNDQNKGFGVACNQGAAELDTDFLLFLNPDAALAADTLARLLVAADKYKDASAFNPRIISPDGEQCFKRNSHLFPRSDKMARGSPEQDKEVTVLSGAALLIRRDAFEKVSGFDENIFLYHEDDDIALRLRENTGRLMFVRDAVVTHLEGQSSVPSPEIAALKAWHMARSRVYATRKHGRPIPFARALHSAIRQLLSVAVLFSEPKRSEQVAYLYGVLSTFRDGGATREVNK